MRAIAGPIVVFSGAFLWSAGTIGYSLMYMAKQGNIDPPQFATWGGVAISVVGLLLTVAAFARDKDIAR
ncbi:MAG: hypothetical protein SGJ19_29340 [Planctomycetia bacterium]|nr:hypothetical protein [Planctomycetia bacterium]